MKNYPLFDLCQFKLCANTLFSFNDAKILKKSHISKIFQEKYPKMRLILTYVIPLIYINLYKKSEHPLLDAPF